MSEFIDQARHAQQYVYTDERADTEQYKRLLEFMVYKTLNANQGITCKQLTILLHRQYGIPFPVTEATLTVCRLVHKGLDGKVIYERSLRQDLPTGSNKLFYARDIDKLVAEYSKVLGQELCLGFVPEVWRMPRHAPELA